MKITNGKILIFFGIIHPLLGISPFAFGKQFSGFAKKFFFKISEGLSTCLFSKINKMKQFNSSKSII